jgi:hypothetical protein
MTLRSKTGFSRSKGQTGSNLVVRANGASDN